MNNVVCVLRSGGVYDFLWVAKLLKNVRQHISTEFEFHCLTDLEFSLPGVNTIPLENNWPGWWSKIEVFRESLFTGQVLYLDLDVLAVGSLDPLFKPKWFWMTEDFVLRRGFHNSSVMAFRAGTQRKIYKRFSQKPEIFMHDYDKKRLQGRIGDQAFIEDTQHRWGYPIRTFDKSEVVSYKIHARNGPPDNARVVAFHGLPKMPKAGGWAQAMWEAL